MEEAAAEGFRVDLRTPVKPTGAVLFRIPRGREAANYSPMAARRRASPKLSRAGSVDAKEGVHAAQWAGDRHARQSLQACHQTVATTLQPGLDAWHLSVGHA